MTTTSSDPRIAPGDVYVGMDLGYLEYVIAPETVRDFADAVEDHNPWYTGSSPFGGPVAPALILHNATSRFRGWYLKNIYGNLHAKQEWDLYHPIMVGQTVRLHAMIVDRYLRRNREYVVNEAHIMDETGRFLARSRHYQSFLADETVTGVVVDRTREKAAERRFDIPSEGTIADLPPLRKLVTLEVCKKFSGPAKNYHNDVEEARKLGFPDIVVQGTLSICYLSEMMTGYFGEGWYCGGRLALNLVNILWVNEAVTARGVIRSITPEGSRQRAHLDIWCEKDDGTKIIVGTASAIMPQK